MCPVAIGSLSSKRLQSPNCWSSQSVPWVVVWLAPWVSSIHFHFCGLYFPDAAQRLKSCSKGNIDLPPCSEFLQLFANTLLSHPQLPL